MPDDWGDRPRPPLVGDERGVRDGARHNAHADLLREAIDGMVGADTTRPAGPQCLRFAPEHP